MRASSTACRRAGSRSTRPAARAEEFPRFTDFWLERPAPDARQLTILALLDSSRATGAYQFDIAPGSQTVTRVRARIFLRAGAKPITTLGIAPLTSMFYFGENQPRSGDFRPEVHDSDGLMVETGNGEWLWRPLQNPARPTATAFSTNSVRGFGLMQRDRSFTSYEDVESRYDRRPSAWVKPAGRLGPRPRRVAALAHARRNARQRGRLLGAGQFARARQAAGFRLRDFMAGRRAAARAGQLGHADAARLRLRGRESPATAGGPGPVHRGLRRTGIGRIAARRAVRAVVSSDAERPRRRTTRLPQSRRRRLAHDGARAADRPRSPVELRAFLQDDKHI